MMSQEVVDAYIKEAVNGKVAVVGATMGIAHHHVEAIYGTDYPNGTYIGHGQPYLVWEQTLGFYWDNGIFLTCEFLTETVTPVYWREFMSRLMEQGDTNKVISIECGDVLDLQGHIALLSFDRVIGDL